MKKKQNKYTVIQKGNFTKIYINDLLHICIPNSKKVIVQNWITNKSWFTIQIKVGKQKDILEYDDFEKWSAIIKLLDSTLQ